MASNAELRESITALAIELGVDKPNTANLSNSKLVELLGELAGAAAEPMLEVVVVARVSDGMSLTSKKGVLASGTEVKPEFFAEGAYDALIKKGFITLK